MSAERPRFFAAGNEAVGFIALGNKATGFIAVGNLVTGVFAFGNVARGVVAVGNVAVGVVAVGNVGVGVFGLGASVAAGIVSYGAAASVPALEGASLSGATLPVPFGGLLLCVVLIGLSFLMRGKRRPWPDLPPMIRLGALLGGDEAEGFVAGRVRPLDGSTASVKDPSAEATVELSASALAALSSVSDSKRCLARLRVERRAIPDERGGYRDMEHERVVICEELRPYPTREAFWSKSEYVLYPIAWVWRLAGPVAAILSVGRAILGWW